MTALNSAIHELDRATTTPELVRATQTLCGLKDLEAAPTLIKVLGFNNPAVGAVATQGLIDLGRDVVVLVMIVILSTSRNKTRCNRYCRIKQRRNYYQIIRVG